jgi:hypothetical protein
MTLLPSIRSFVPGICLVVVILALIPPGAGAISLTPGGSTATVIAQGDPLYIRGVATGQPQVGLQIWFIGTNFAKVMTVPVNNDDTYEYELYPADTANLASGEYVVVIQHPMMNGRFDIIYDAATGNVINVQTGQNIYRFTGSGSLTSTDAAAALINAISSQNIDDTFTTVSFFVNSPAVGINPIGDRQVGDTFAMNGTTNLAVGDDLNVQIFPASFQPTAKTQPVGGSSGAAGMVKVMPGIATANSWSFYINTAGFAPGAYIVTVSGVLVDVTATATFNLVSAGSSTSTANAGPAGTLIVNVTAPLNGTAIYTSAGNQSTTAVSTSGTGTIINSGTSSGTPAANEPSTAPASLPRPVTTTYTPLPVALGIIGLAVAVAIHRFR